MQYYCNKIPERATSMFTSSYAHDPMLILCHEFLLNFGLGLTQCEAENFEYLVTIQGKAIIQHIQTCNLMKSYFTPKKILSFFSSCTSTCNV
jgi:hypothetical protein